MKKTLIAAAVMAASVGVHAQTFFEMEAGIGMTHYDTPNTRWNQENMPNNGVVKNAPEFSLGLTGHIISHGAYGMDWHADYVNLGRAAAQCSCTPIDANYNPSTKQRTNDYKVDDAFFTGSGRAQGVAMTLEPYYWTHGLRLGFEAGVFAYHSDWTEYVAGWSQNDTMAKQSFSLSNHAWNIAPVVGASIGNGRVTLSYRHYFLHLNSQKASVPPVWNDADVLELKVKF